MQLYCHESRASCCPPSLLLLLLSLPLSWAAAAAAAAPADATAATIAPYHDYDDDYDRDPQRDALTILLCFEYSRTASDGWRTFIRVGMYLLGPAADPETLSAPSHKP